MCSTGVNKQNIRKLLGYYNQHWSVWHNNRCYPSLKIVLWYYQEESHQRSFFRIQKAKRKQSPRWNSYNGPYCCYLIACHQQPNHDPEQMVCMPIPCGLISQLASLLTKGTKVNIRNLWKPMQELRIHEMPRMKPWILLIRPQDWTD